MNEYTLAIVIACITGSFALIGTAVTVYVNYIQYIRNKNGEMYKKRLIQAYKDIIAFRQLEEMYAMSISNDPNNPTTAIAVKRHFRSLLRESGDQIPSDASTVLRCAKELAKLTSSKE